MKVVEEDYNVQGKASALLCSASDVAQDLGSNSIPLEGFYASRGFLSFDNRSPPILAFVSYILFSSRIGVSPVRQ